VLLCSCNDNVYFTAHHHFDESLWYKEDVIKIPIEQFLTYKDSTERQEIQLSIGLRYTDEYKYNTVYIKTQLSDKKKIVRCDTLQFTIPDKGCDGFSFRKQVQALMNFTADGSSTYTLSITHIMKQNPLTGITDLIIGCDKIGNTR